MSGYLTKIKTKIPYSNKEVDINVNGKTLILTGANGCGKTQLISHLFTKLAKSVIERDNGKVEDLKNQLSFYTEQFNKGPTHRSYDTNKKI
ncbi:hypothetical protein ACK3Y8_19550 [Aeromonas caviae]